MALNIPILPVAIDDVPGQMAADLQAIVVKIDFSDFAEKISTLDLERVVLSQQGQAFSNIEISNEEIYTESGLKPGASRQAAIQHIQEILSE